ncbi:hypothetical protein V2J09_019647 [Rumex salicifolius]
MGHCGDEEGDRPIRSVTDSGAAVTFSPADSKFSALICSDILRIIFEKLSISDLARASCVCRIWYSLASDGEIQTAAFRAPWKLKEVVGSPTSGSFWRDNSLKKFAISHRIVRGDSVSSLAVKYSVQVMEIRRLNNMMSDHGIYSRDRILIPVDNPETLVGRTCYIELDKHAKREVAVLYLDGCPDSRNSVSLADSGSKAASSEQGRRRVIESLSRSMHVDDETALYYLSISNGNPRAALSEFSEDVNWERQSGTM